ncbi:MAG: hypothetical protein ACN4GT_08065 [Gammaproteobacteria bacterium]
MRIRNTFPLLTGIFALFAGAPASSMIVDTISFSNWTGNNAVDVTPSFNVGLDDGGFFAVSVGIDAGSTYTGQITGIYFDLGVDGFAESNISNSTHTDYATDDSKINGVTNLNLGDFDVILGYSPKTNSFPVTFDVAQGTLDLDDWTRVGVRWQDTTGPEGSDKTVSITAVRDTPPISLSEPMTLGLFGFGLAFIALQRRREADAR